MWAYIARRLLLLPLLIFLVTLFVFGMYSFLPPSQRVRLYLPDVAKSPDAAPRIIAKYGLDKPFHIQYIRWLGNLIRGDFGWSQTAQRPVLQALGHYFPATLELALWAMVPVIFVGIWLGILSAIHHNRPLDHATRVFALIGWSFPSFVYGLLLIMVFYAWLRWLPVGRISDWVLRLETAGQFKTFTGMYTIDAILNGRPDVLADALRHLVMPVFTLAYIQWALLLRITRSSMLETLRQEYVMTARAKGLAERVVIYKHAARNAMIPVATVGGLLLIGLLNGVVITETIFNYPGLGSWAANAASQLDILSVLGFALFNCALLVLGNLFVDILYAVIDPRIRLE
ncbi:MAG: ABC transporter permease [Candidatus Bipolaricaulota bacterium]|nr:ABC transporter permease [Candidatus Bipolaricaulota bacterium]MDW8127326.1 ABC transporter permease [Candidatus Bipolaricaulota bacterium]